MSMPMTCVPARTNAPREESQCMRYSQLTCGTHGPHHDWLQYVLYSPDSELLRQMIIAASMNIERTHAASPCVAEALRPYAPGDLDSMLTLRIKFIVLLNADEITRNQLCKFTSSIARDRRPLCPKKATRFYAELDKTLLPAWVRDQTVSHAEFIDSVRDAYLVS